MAIPYAPPVGEWSHVPTSWLTASLNAPAVVANPSAAWVYTGRAVNSWCSAAWDEARQELWLPIGGGHGDRFANDSFKFKLATGTWERVDEPTSGPAPTYDYPYISYLSDGWYPVGGAFGPGGAAATGWLNVPKPVTRHTYDGVCFLPPPVDRVCVLGGVCANDGSYGNEYYPALLHPTAYTWARSAAAMTPDALISLIRMCGTGAYDPVDGTVFFRNQRRVSRYRPVAGNPAGDTWQVLADSPWFTSGFYGVTVYSPVDDAFWSFGTPGSGEIPPDSHAIRAVTRPTFSEASVTTASITGGSPAAVAHAEAAACWHAGLNRIARWYGGPDVYLLDPLTRQLDVVTLGGTPPPSQAALNLGIGYGFSNGIFAKMQYSIANDVLVLIYDGQEGNYTGAAAGTEGVYYARLPGSITPPSPPGQLVFSNNPVTFS